MPRIPDLSNRYPLANELHARPFPTIFAPARAIVLAIKPAENAAGRDRSRDLAHLIDLLDRHGAPHPQPGATHYSGQIGRHHLKWESHSEFLTYTIIGPGVADQPFDARTFELSPQDWLDAAPGERLTSILIRIEVETDEDKIQERVADWFVPESLAISHILDRAAVVASDFRIDPAGHTRIAVFSNPETGPQRVGRIVQRLAEIETYKSMSMLGLARMRKIQPQLGALDQKLTDLVGGMAGVNGVSDSAREQRNVDTLRHLLEMSADLEALVAQSSFRFGATRAYRRIVDQRIEILRETRFHGRQSFQEFMMRRFDPAMRTVEATSTRLDQLAERATRAGNLLRTRVEVERSAQNQKVLASMDRRADLQLRLQETVEGLSVVAISYYAVSLAAYFFAPLAAPLGITKTWMTAGLVIPVLMLVWAAIRRIRKRMEQH